MTTPLGLEVDAVLDEFFPEGLPPSKTEAAIAARQCRVLTRLDEPAHQELESGHVGQPPPALCTSS